MVWLEDELVPANSPKPVHPPVKVAREILYYLCEANFRIELFTLDFFLYNPMRTVSTTNTPTERLDTIQRRIPYLVDSKLPIYFNGGNGFSSADIQERFQSAYGLVHVMQEWTRDKRCTPCRELIAQAVELKEEEKAGGVLSEEKVASLESAAFEHYIRSFVLVFARAPSIPHHCRVPDSE